MQLVNFTVIAGGLFLITGFLHQRLGSTDVLSLGGAARSMPLLASFFLFFGLAAMGIPGTSGFPAELLIMIAALQTHTGAGLAALFGMVISAGYFLAIHRRTFLGPVAKPEVATASDLRPRELAILLAFALFVLGVGLYPTPILDVIRPAAETWVSRLNSTRPGRLPDPEPPFRFRSNEGRLFGVVLPPRSRNRRSAFRPERTVKISDTGRS